MTRKSYALASALLAVALVSAVPAAMADTSRQDTVAKRGADVMPFSLKASTHVFTKTQSGGVQQVVAKNPGDTQQIGLIREHMKDIAGQFSHGNFSAPSQLHGAGMPGLAELRAAKPSDIAVQYRDIDNGGEIAYISKNPELVAAIHKWFDAQVSDHGADAMAGHDHSRMHH